MDKIKIVNISSGEKGDELRQEILNLINEYSDSFNGYELLGVVDVIREDIHNSINDYDEE